MELVYLWVKKYKKIEKQGFNFSPRFRCEYDEDRNELKIDKNKNHSSIFPLDVSAVAIVGENGSGKSSISELILLSLFNAIKKNNGNKYFMLVYDCLNEKFLLKSFDIVNHGFDKVYEDNKLLPSNSNNKYFFKHLKEEDFFTIHYNPSLEMPSSFFQKIISEGLQSSYGSIYDMDYKPMDKLNIFSFPSKKNNQINIRSIENTSILNMFKVKRLLKDKKLKNFFEELFFYDNLLFEPTRISLELDKDILSIRLKNEYLREIIFKYEANLTLKNLYVYFLMLIISTSHMDYKDNKTFRDYFLKEGKIKNYLKEKYENIRNADNEGLAYSSYVNAKFAKNIYDDIENFMKLSNGLSLEESLLKNSELLDSDVHETAKLVDVINKINCNDVSIRTTSDLKVIEQILPVLPSYIKVDVSGKCGNKFSDFSSGEKNIINLGYSLIFYILFYGKKKEFISLVLDEIEVGIHPVWQKNLVTMIVELINECKKIEGYRNLKFLLTIFSHSPFILSDMPKENVIFLEEGKQVYPQINTFGANIHTLLSHGFFMKDGLIGEFAKSKIEEVIKYLNCEKSEVQDNNQAQKMINIIGEPIIKNHLQKMLDSKRCSKVEIIEKQLKELQEELRKHKHDKD